MALLGHEPEPAAWQTHLIAAFARGEEVRADGDAPVPWWSYAKTVLAGAALALVTEGRLQLDEPVRGRPFTLRVQGSGHQLPTLATGSEPTRPGNARNHDIETAEEVWRFFDTGMARQPSAP